MANPKEAFEIFCSALEFESAEERDAYVVEACGNKSELLAEVRGLLKSDRESGGFLDDNGAAKSLIGTLDHNAVDSIHEEVGSKIGPYKLLQKIGEGGFGVVFMAEQVQPVSRKVALKVIKLGMDTKEVIARFEAERQALAMMDHPNIARIFDAGATATGRPYFVMELVHGLPITEYCSRNKSSKQERLDLFTSVCHAIESAHLKGIIHRDIKPTNVLVTLNYGQPTVKVIDFGVAKATNQRLTEKTLFTRFGTMVGTPAYMSPEQAELTSIDVDRRTDVYSLGVLLYELLTGTTPFSEERLRTAGFAEMQRIIAEEDPELPSSRVSTIEGQQSSSPSNVEVQTKSDELKGDLDWITLKCLEKDRRRRYDTASAIVNDIRRHLDQETVSAVAPSLSYQFSKFYQRNKLLAKMLTLVLATLAIGLATTTWQWWTAENERALAVDARRTADDKSAEALRQTERAEVAEAEAKIALEQTSEALYTSSLAVARLEIENRKTPEAIAALERTPQQFRDWEWDFLKLRTSSQLLKLTGHTNWVYKAKFSPDGQLIASSGGGNPFWKSFGKQTPGQIIIWDAYTGQRLRTLEGHKHVIPDIAFSPDGKTLASASDTVRLWDVQSGAVLKEFEGGTYTAIAFSPDGKTLAAGRTSQMMLWNLFDKDSKKLETPKGFDFGGIRFHKDSSRIYAAPAHFGDKILAWNTDTGELISDFAKGSFGHGAFAISDHPVATSPKKNTLSIAASSGKNLAEYFTSGKLYYKTGLHNGPIFGVDYHPTNGGHRRLATGSMDSTIRLHGGLDVDNFLLGHADRVLDVDFSPLGDRLVSAGSDGTVRVWDTSTNLASGDVPLPRDREDWKPDRVESIVFRKENGRIAVARSGRAFSIDDAHTPWHVNRIESPGNPYMQEPMRFDPDGNVLVGCQGQIIRCWEFPSFEKRHEFRAHEKAIWLLSCDRGANKIASVAHLGTEKDLHSELKVWNGKTGDLLYTVDEPGTVVNRMAFSPEGKLLVVACTVTENPHQDDQPDETVSSTSVIKLLDAQTGKLLKSLDGVQDRWMGICFDSAGKLVAAAGTNKNSVLVWNTETGEYKESKDGLRGARDIAFHPDGNRLAMVSPGQTKVLDAETLRELLTLQSRGQKGYTGDAVNPRVCWSHDGYSLAVGSNSLSIWKIPSPDEKAKPIDDVMEDVRRRAIARRLRLAEDYARMGIQPDRGKQLLESLSSVELSNADQYRIRAWTYARLGMEAEEKADLEKADSFK